MPGNDEERALDKQMLHAQKLGHQVGKTESVMAEMERLIYEYQLTTLLTRLKRD